MKPGSRVACKLKLLFFFRVWGGVEHAGFGGGNFGPS